MKKKLLFCGAAALAFAAIVASNVNSNTNNTLSATSLANIEALAQGELGWFYCTTYPMPLICVKVDDLILDTGDRIYI